MGTARDRQPAGLPSLEIRRVLPDHEDARYLIERVQAIYTERYGGRDEDPVGRAEFSAPAGRFYVGYRDGVPVASGAWRRTTHAALGAGETAELKRMYVVEEAQRLGIGRQMLAHLEGEVAAAGVAVIVLSTGGRQPEAIALYEQAGYERVAGFGLYAASPQAHFFAKRVR